MAAPQSTTTRRLALAAIILVAGLFSLRALDLFNTPVQAPASGTPLEQRLTNLIEPLIGQDKVRIGIYQSSSDARSFLIMIDQTPPLNEADTSLQENIERVLIASAGFSADRDTLTYIQQPFAAGALTSDYRPFAELIGLFGLAILIFMIGFTRAREDTLTPPKTTYNRTGREPPLNQPVEQDSRPAPIHAAAKVAAQNPEGSAALIRKWMVADTGAKA